MNFFSQINRISVKDKIIKFLKVKKFLTIILSKEVNYKNQ